VRVLSMKGTRVVVAPLAPNGPTRSPQPGGEE
jgi:hypothetical protein